MATVTGFTAERMLAMENATIIDGDVVGDNLILTKKDGSTVNAGNVRGPTGSPGITNAEMGVHVPAGMIVDYIGTVAPTNWLGMTGQTIAGGQSLYPNLWAVLPTSMKSGTSIVMPDTRGRISAGYNSADTDFDAIGKTGGSKTVTLTQAQLPNVTITIDPPATAVTGTSASQNRQHVHLPGGHNYFVVQDAGGAGGVSIVAGNMQVTYSGGTSTEVGTVGEAGGPHEHNAGSYSVNIPAFQSGALGSGQPHSVVQPYITFMKIIKAV